MRTIITIPKQLALTAVGIVVLSLGLVLAVTPAKAGPEKSVPNVGAQYFAIIDGPGTVWGGVTCTWTATTNIPNPQFEWSVSIPQTFVVGWDPYVSYAFQRNPGGAHQGLNLIVSNSSGALATDGLLVGVFFPGVGNPDCP